MEHLESGAVIISPPSALPSSLSQPCAGSAGEPWSRAAHRKRFEGSRGDPGVRIATSILEVISHLNLDKVYQRPKSQIVPSISMSILHFCSGRFPMVSIISSPSWHIRHLQVVVQHLSLSGQAQGSDALRAASELCQG